MRASGSLVAWGTQPWTYILSLQNVRHDLNVKSVKISSSFRHVCDLKHSELTRNKVLKLWVPTAQGWRPSYEDQKMPSKLTLVLAKMQVVDTFECCLRDSTTGAPNVRFGTKCPLTQRKFALKNEKRNLMGCLYEVTIQIIVNRPLCQDGGSRLLK